ncbi:MAG: LD-carboxypeptidase [Christensenellaceae bacterium]|nr:LD-carboxypeptidase [Christensenellaceae bacterium]MEA5066891.1 LD-carboxypeptidase [Eubacteriales bacterium]MEA5069717.1 LD-carboxypeptidase [Christensenellaceae bacterium]
MIKARALAPGGTLGFVGASGALGDPEALTCAAAKAEAMGYRVVLGLSCTARYGYLSGDDALRARDLNRMFSDDAIDAVVCIRGGYGAPRILDLLDYEAAARYPKPLIGYSDITALHLAYQRMSGLITFHAPMPTGDWVEAGFEAFSAPSMFDCLSGTQVGVPLRNPEGIEPRCLRSGEAEGRLVGGNLTLICALTGTRYMPDLQGAILLLEDVDERLYRVDRMLTQLRLAGAFDACAGVVLGQFTRCDSEYEDRALSFEEIVRDVVLPSGKPTLSNLMIGHVPDKLTVALGARYRLDAARGALTLLEAPCA